ncbi:hypothetical protein CEXT_767211 [Caerostris extrusa]|uniref:Uncharacterized protein n=1 Tax=Caerostris extrusa TaxID=172846 RepID=A0AAV4P2C5_CAEEX|nr:hypothetical protein CEXT_767211 [Caerostris extrusa]
MEKGYDNHYKKIAKKDTAMKEVRNRERRLKNRRSGSIGEKERLLLNEKNPVGPHPGTMIFRALICTYPLHTTPRSIFSSRVDSNLRIEEFYFRKSSKNKRGHFL